jgi:hypothetical protein
MTSIRPVARWLTVALDERQDESLGKSSSDIPCQESLLISLEIHLIA